MEAIITYVLPALIGAVPALLVALWQGRKTEAETAKARVDSAETITQSALKLIEPMKKRIADLESWVQELENQLMKQEKLILELLNGSARLHEQVKEAGEEPVFTIPCYEPIKRKKKRGHPSTRSHSS
jgi:gas vesicle protein